jgi:hypothetical protein
LTKHKQQCVKRSYAIEEKKMIRHFFRQIVRGMLVHGEIRRGVTLLCLTPTQEKGAFS